MRCHSCTTVVAVCDECELVWLDIAAVKEDPQRRSSAAFPKCPACHSKQPYWSRLTRKEIEKSSSVAIRGRRADRPEQKMTNDE